LVVPENMLVLKLRKILQLIFTDKWVLIINYTQDLNIRRCIFYYRPYALNKIVTLIIIDSYKYAIQLLT
jgi:hypothetical protein